MLSKLLQKHKKAIKTELFKRTKRAGSCRIYTGGKSPGRYGWFTFKLDEYVHFTTTAHVASWMIAHNDYPAGRHVLHTCDHKLCIEPRHLWAGTHAENMADKTLKGRQAKGAAMPQSKLTTVIVTRVRKLVRRESEHLGKGSRTGLVKQLAEKYQVSGYAMYCAIHGKTWAHVVEPPVPPL